MLGAVACAEGYAARYPGRAVLAGCTKYGSLEELLRHEGGDSTPLDALSRYRKLERYHIERKRARAAESGRSLALAVCNPLPRWERSLRVVLAAEDELGVPFVGLLLAESPLFRED